jgi:hypothetical protein
MFGTKTTYLAALATAIMSVSAGSYNVRLTLGPNVKALTGGAGTTGPAVTPISLDSIFQPVSSDYEITTSAGGRSDLRGTGGGADVAHQGERTGED